MSKHTPDEVTYVPETERDRERIDACLFACTGIPTEALKEGAVKGLAEAMKQIIECRHARRGGGPLACDLQDLDEALRDVIEIASAALASFKEEG